METDLSLGFSMGDRVKEGRCPTSDVSRLRGVLSTPAPGTFLVISCFGNSRASMRATRYVKNLQI